MGISLTESQTITALRLFLLSILPVGIEVVRGLDNRVPEPIGPDFVTMTPISRERIESNVSTYEDCAFVGSISGTTLTVASVQLGALAVGNTLLGNNLVAGTAITAFGSGAGGVGTYAISQSQTVASQTIAAGTRSIMQPAKVGVQLDVHGPNSGDNAQAIAALFFDDYAFQSFAGSGFDVRPLYAGEPHQMPFLNGEQQIEERWVVDVWMQCNPVLSVTQQFADEVVITTTAPA